MRQFFFKSGPNCVQECVHWDIQTNSWAVSGSRVLASNATHTTCSFSYLSTYAVVRAQSGPATPSQPLLLLIARSHKLTSIASISSSPDH